MSQEGILHFLRENASRFFSTRDIHEQFKDDAKGNALSDNLKKLRRWQMVEFKYQDRRFWYRHKNDDEKQRKI